MAAGGRRRILTLRGGAADDVLEEGVLRGHEPPAAARHAAPLRPRAAASHASPRAPRLPRAAAHTTPPYTHKPSTQHYN